MLNDYRLDAIAGAEAARRQRHRKQHLANVSVIEVVDKAFGRPHILFALTRDVEKGEELLTDYGDEFWTSYASFCRWMAALRHARSSGLAAGRMEARSELTVQQAARRSAEESKENALKKVEMLEQQIASLGSGIKFSKTGRLIPAAAHASSPPVCPLSEPAGSSRRVGRKRPRTEAPPTFQSGDRVTCPECNQWLQAPTAAKALRCCACNARVYPDAQTPPSTCHIETGSSGDADGCLSYASNESKEDRADVANVVAKRARRSQPKQQQVFNFTIGAVVWAKYKKHPYWPAVVSKLRGNEQVDEETRSVLQKEYSKLRSTGSTSPAVVLVRWFGYENEPAWDWIDLNKLSGAQCKAVLLVASAAALWILQFLLKPPRGVARLSHGLFMYAAWNSPYSKPPDQNDKVRAGLFKSMTDDETLSYQSALVEAAVHFVNTKSRLTLSSDVR